MTTMDDLTAFITARQDEDEDLARDLLSAHPGPWRVDLPSDVRDSAGKVVVADEDHWSPMPHIARHDPARALREVAAKRAMLAEHQPFTAWEGPETGNACCAAETSGNDAYAMSTPWPCTTARAIAAIWSDHHDYRPEWAASEPS